MYTSKYYTCEEIDERLLRGYYDDALSKGYEGTFDEFKSQLANVKTINVMSESEYSKLQDKDSKAIYMTFEDDE